MTACVATEKTRTDAELDRRWAIALTAMKRRDAADRSRAGGPGYAAALLLSQRAWLAFRDRQCVFEGLVPAVVSIQPTVVAMCRARMTTERIRQLSTQNIIGSSRKG